MDAADVKERYGVLPRADDRPQGAEGRHLRQHPRHPRRRRQDRDQAHRAVRLGRGRCIEHVDEVTAGRSCRRSSASTPTSCGSRKHLATIVRDVPVGARPGGRRLLRALRPGARAGAVPRAGVPHADPAPAAKKVRRPPRRRAPAEAIAEQQFAIVRDETQLDAHRGSDQEAEAVRARPRDARAASRCARTSSASRSRSAPARRTTCRSATPALGDDGAAADRRRPGEAGAVIE